MKKFLLLVTCLFLFFGHVKAEGIVQQYESTYTEQLKIKSSYTPTTADFKRSLEKSATFITVIASLDALT